MGESGHTDAFPRTIATPGAQKIGVLMPKLVEYHYTDGSRCGDRRGDTDAVLFQHKYALKSIKIENKSIADQAGRNTIETCMNVIVLSLAMVMSGTGNVEVLRVCRLLHAARGQAHAHVLYDLTSPHTWAIGLLFLGAGRYTLSTSDRAIAAMLCAFFPKFPIHSNG
ncbi:PREDICTED: anaphase-promoting complex subunit 1-like [Priapulus caudatus]|uniref:Anaphase-promoting complex subunit 1-like n=1 Tax=Priapulus caudatus TaxID=37621 RepID=A0ABM1EZJ0_PRICU|nr:PREDICTED: anaphase-promoting complex subunit 1-like [Priapulus caudatus]